MKCEVEAGEVERPSGLPPVQLLGCHEVLQVLVVRPNLALMFCAFDKVLPLLEGSDDCQHLHQENALVKQGDPCAPKVIVRL